MAAVCDAQTTCRVLVSLVRAQNQYTDAVQNSRWQRHRRLRKVTASFARRLRDVVVVIVAVDIQHQQNDTTRGSAKKHVQYII